MEEGLSSSLFTEKIALVSEAEAKTGATTELPKNKCITVSEMESMAGSGGNGYEIPASSLENITETGVTLIVIDYGTGDNPAGLISLECNGDSTSYDLQNVNTAIILNVGAAGNITSFTRFDVSIESGGWKFTVFAMDGTHDGYFTGVMYSDYSESDRSLSFSYRNSLYSALVIAEKFS